MSDLNDDSQEQLPARIGPYRILRRLGEGGMGVVYEAEQSEPIRRNVALKVIRAGMDTRQVVARFQAERQALAVMEHPSIAKVFEGGATEDGRPFFMMELVKGTPITEYCDTHQLSTEDRLRLFGQVCDAVQHAHQKGVIHRDLKPSNVLVTVSGEAPLAKVIDFGIAKAVGHDPTGDASVTRIGQLVGTPDYMSPEQAEMSGLDIDTRTDVYSLGVLLYELLVGALPHDFGRIPDVAVGAVIRQHEPPRPSRRLTTLTGEEQDAVARHRRTDPGTLERVLKGDLDWIVMRCLEKDRTRRYETVNGLGRDLLRYLASEPVVARPPTASYRLQKFVRRNRVAVFAASGVATAIVLGIGSTLWQWREAVTAREAMASALEEANAASAFTIGLFRASDPLLEERGDTVSARTLLERGAQRVREELSDQPRLQTRMLGEIGQVHANLGMLAVADSLISEAFALWSSEVSSSDSLAAALLDDLSTVKSSLGANDTAMVLGEQALQRWRSIFGDEHLATANSMNNLAVVYYYLSDYEAGLALGEQALSIRQRELEPGHPDIAEAMDNTAALLQGVGRIEEATAMRFEAVAMAKEAHGERHPAVATPLQNLAVLLGDLDRWGEAEPYLREAIAIRTELLGPDHPDLGYAYHNLAVNVDRQGRPNDALPHYREALRIKELNFGKNSSYARSLEQMAAAYASLERFVQAEGLYDEVQSVYEAASGDNRVDLAFVNNYRGELYLKQSRFTEALPPLQAAHETAVAVFGLDHPRTAQFGGNLGACLAGLGRVEAARELLESSLAALIASLGEEHGTVALTRSRLATLPDR